MGLVGIPSMTAAYSSLAKEQLPMATASLNLVQRIGGPTLTTICAVSLGLHLGASGFAFAFAVLCGFHSLVFFTAMRLPLLLPKRPGKTSDRQQLTLIEAAE
jgi:hypothetical protein